VNKNDPTFRLLRDPFPPEPPEDLLKYHIEHDPRENKQQDRKEVVRSIMRMASKKKATSKAKQKRRAVYRPEYIDDFGFAEDMMAFDAIYDKFYGSYEAELKSGNKFGASPNFNLFTKKNAGLSKSGTLSETERRLNIPKRK
jgi:hypothetical protein